MKRIAIFLIVYILFSAVLFAGGSAENPGQENTGVQASSDTALEGSAGSVANREEALDALRSIGMTVFEEEVEAPDFSLPLMSGEQASLADYRGKVVFLNFWATWCGPCRVEMPSMQDLYADLRSEDFVILAINQLEDPDIVDDFLQEEGYTFPVLLDDGQVSFQYGVRGIPTTYIIGPDGLVIAGKVGTHIYDGRIYREMFRALM